MFICRPWLSAELEEVDPEIVVALGATAAFGVGGREFAIQKERGRLLPLEGSRKLLVTVHPSFLLRAPEQKRAAWRDLLALRARLDEQLSASP